MRRASAASTRLSSTIRQVAHRPPGPRAGAHAELTHRGETGRGGHRQIRLIEAYRAALSRHGIIAAQVLVTPDDTEARKRHLNARATLTALLDFGRCR